MRNCSSYICAILIMCLASIQCFANSSQTPAETEGEAETTAQKAIDSNAPPSGKELVFDPDFLKLLKSMPAGIFSITLKNGEQHVGKINVHPDRLFIWTNINSFGIAVTFEEITSIKVAPKAPRTLFQSTPKKSNRTAVLIAIPLVLLGVILLAGKAMD